MGGKIIQRTKTEGDIKLGDFEFVFESMLIDDQRAGEILSSVSKDDALENPQIRPCAYESAHTKRDHDLPLWFDRVTNARQALSDLVGSNESWIVHNRHSILISRHRDDSAKLTHLMVHFLDELG